MSRKAQVQPSKKDLFFLSIRSENVSQLRWSLQNGAFTVTKPYDEQTDLPPIHLAVRLRKLKSLKCLLESIDRVHAQKDIDYRDPENGCTPLMIALKLGWIEGANLLLENGADVYLQNQEQKNKSVIKYASTESAKELIEKFIQEQQDASVEDEDSQDLLNGETSTQRSKRKKKELLMKEQGLLVSMATYETSSSKLNDDQENSDNYFSSLGHIEIWEKEQEAARNLVQWDIVKVTIAETRRDLNIGPDLPELFQKTQPCLDPAIFECRWLQNLHIQTKASLGSFPDSLKNLINLTTLVLDSNNLVSLPDVFDSLPNLKVLEAQNNKLQALPPTLSNCSVLQVINVANNSITSLAPLAKCTQLATVHADHNNIVQIDDLNIDGLTRLTTLSISHNQIEELPDNFEALDFLTSLNVAHNNITKVPFSIGKLKEKRFQEIYLEGNSITDRKLEKILSKGNKPMKEFLQYIRKLEETESKGRGGKGSKKKNRKQKERNNEKEDNEEEEEENYI